MAVTDTKAKPGHRRSEDAQPADREHQREAERQREADRPHGADRQREAEHQYGADRQREAERRAEPPQGAERPQGAEPPQGAGEPPDGEKGSERSDSNRTKEPAKRERAKGVAGGVGIFLLLGVYFVWIGNEMGSHAISGTFEMWAIFGAIFLGVLALVAGGAISRKRND